MDLFACRRLMGVLEASNGRVVVGGDSDASERYISPTVLTDVTAEDALMEDEVFGPLLPIVPVSNVDEAIQFVNKL